MDRFLPISQQDSSSPQWRLQKDVMKLSLDRLWQCDRQAMLGGAGLCQHAGSIPQDCS